MANLEIRILAKQANHYPVELTLDGTQEFRSGYLDADIYPWVPDVDRNRDGETLLHRLFADEKLRNAWFSIRSKHSDDLHILLDIDTNAPELHTIPWELLRYPTLDDVYFDLAYSLTTPFSRYLPHGQEPSPPLLNLPIKILVVISNPKNLDTFNLTQIDVAKEWWNSLQNAIPTLYKQ